MADDEQFSLCWNNFNSNLSAGFHESLCRGDLVDVTLAAEGQLVKAHRLVLSVCSPYFRKMFTQMPANQHAFVFLKDVSHTALKDLIQFMYCGEVNVKQEALPAFISTAEALQIKGLTDSDPPPSQSPAEPSTPTPQIQQITSPRVQRQSQRNAARTYKLESVDDSDNDKQPTQIVIQTTAAPQTTTISAQPQHHLQQTQSTQQQIATAAATTTSVVTHKRPAQRSNLVTAPHIKRTKSTIDPLDVTDATNTQQISVQTTVVSGNIKQQQQQQQQTTEAEYIDLPIELPTKSEPDYSEEAGEVETGDHDAAYVEDDSYGDMRYDETYFTENDEAANATAGNISGNESVSTATTSKAIVKQDISYVESGEQTNSDAQDGVNKTKKIVVQNINLPKKRGRRPKLNKDVNQQEKLIDKITTAITKNHGQKAIYVSTTKGGMKIEYDGHHFRYSFRKGQYSIFQCCYKENREECKVRVVSDQKRVYPLDGEHCHYVQAMDKSVTSIKFERSEDEDTQDEDIKTDLAFSAIDEQLYEDTDEKVSNKKEEHKSPSSLMENKELQDNSTNTADSLEFRERIKKRLQKALMGKKK